MSAKNQLVRPQALTPEVQAEIVKALTEGNYLSTACEAAGITYAAFWHWRKRWEDGDPTAQVYADFFDAVKRAIGVAERNLLNTVGQGAMGWQGSAWILERRFRKRWGKKVVYEIEGFDPSQLTDEQLEQLRKGKGLRRRSE